MPFARSTSLTSSSSRTRTSSFTDDQAQASGRLFPVGRHCRLRVADNFQNRPAIAFREVWIARSRLCRRQQLEQPAIDTRARAVGQGVERVAVNHVAERVAKETGAQVELAQRSAPIV